MALFPFSCAGGRRKAGTCCNLLLATSSLLRTDGRWFRYSMSGIEIHYQLSLCAISSYFFSFLFSGRGYSTRQTAHKTCWKRLIVFKLGSTPRTMNFTDVFRPLCIYPSIGAAGEDPLDPPNTVHYRHKSFPQLSHVGGLASQPVRYISLQSTPDPFSSAMHHYFVSIFGLRSEAHNNSSTIHYSLSKSHNQARKLVFIFPPD